VSPELLVDFEFMGGELMSPLFCCVIVEWFIVEAFDHEFMGDELMSSLCLLFDLLSSGVSSECMLIMGEERCFLYFPGVIIERCLVGL
jgi:hypothetical protein